MSPWWPSHALLSWCPTFKLSHCHSFWRSVTLRFIYECPIFKWFWRHITTWLPSGIPLPTGTRRNNNVIMTSKRRRDVVSTSSLLWRRVSVELSRSVNVCLVYLMRRFCIDMFYIVASRWHEKCHERLNVRIVYKLVWFVVKKITFL